MKKIHILLWVMFILIIGGCSSSQSQITPSPNVEKGSINLANWNFETNRLVKLNGDWEFYWHELLMSNDFKAKETPNKTGYIKVPMFWGNKVGEQNLSGHGYATYRMKLKLGEQQQGQSLGIYIPFGVESAYELWVNGELLATAGKVGTSKEKMVGQYYPKVAIFEAKAENEIIIQVSNYVQRTGGLWDPITLGNADEMLHFWNKRLASELFVAGSIVMIGLYHLGLFLIRRNDRSPLYFGLFCLLFGLRSLFLGEVYINHLFPNLDFDIYKKFEYIGQYAGPALFILYVQKLFPSDIHKRMVHAAVVIYALLCTLVILLPASLFTYSLPISHLVLAVYAPYVIFVFIKAAMLRREGALFSCLMFLIMALTVINDLLYYNNIIVTFDMAKFGLFIFIFAQAFLISKKFSKAFKTVENLSMKQARDLQTIDELNEEIESTQREVILTMGEIVETRSKETGFHVKRVAEYSCLLAEKYGLPKEEVDRIRLASPMHDIGKVGISDEILNKPGKLTSEEYDVMKTHTNIGYDMLKHSTRSIMQAAAIIALQHHEKYNGKGYPRGLTGEEIHIFGRITAIADVFDALSSKRVYKSAWDMNTIIQLFKEERGEHFDPILTDLFLEHFDEFNVIYEKYRDEKVF
ncbi:HD domain-containing phosphohydrolase [Neobacillus sp. 3P2-tot-E-2]|uniref:HD domain-containing phosphohydrolase n=1 Tax=Neobacillus sp. 3P2-tot-E-2 TaxID=3132212 RepID=UPI0039A2EF52